jgi:hypothetical protein
MHPPRPPILPFPFLFLFVLRFLFLFLIFLLGAFAGSVCTLLSRALRRKRRDGFPLLAVAQRAQTGAALKDLTKNQEPREQKRRKKFTEEEEKNESRREWIDPFFVVLTEQPKVGSV